MLFTNIAVNYLGQILVSLMGILIAPYYIDQLGPEAYGIVGLSVMLQGWFTLIDMGLSPILGRSCAFFHAQRLPQSEAASLLYSIERVFWLIGVVIFCSLTVGSGPLSSTWLKAEHLSANVVQWSLCIIAAMLVSRWLTGLYRGGLVGFELHIWINKFNLGFAIVRYVLVIPLLWVYPNIIVFLFFQLLVSFVETLVFYKKLHGLVGLAERGFSLALLEKNLSFAGTLFFTTVVWLFATQVDKLLLSGLMPLREYGYLMLAISAATGVQTALAPLQTVLQPKFNILFAQGERDEFLRLYKTSVDVVMLIALPLLCLLLFFSEKMLWVWTGEADVVAYSSYYLRWYGVGNIFTAILVLPYFLQFATGDLRHHLKINIAYALIFVPVLVWAAYGWHGYGAALAWALGNGVVALGWPLFIHSKFLPEVGRFWFFWSTWILAGLSCLLAGLLAKYIELPDSRFGTFVAIMVIWVMLFALNVVSRPGLLRPLHGMLLRWTGLRIP